MDRKGVGFSYPARHSHVSTNVLTGCLARENFSLDSLSKTQSDKMKIRTERVADRRTLMLYVRVTSAEKERLIALAATAGLSVSDWIRTKAIDVRPSLPKLLPGEETMIKMLWHIGKVGTNLNMVTRQLNRKQDSPEFDMPLAEINALLTELKGIAATIRSALHEHH